jgi:hypothetical protein
VPPSRAFRPISSDAVDALVAGIVALLVSLATASITNTGADRYSDMFAPGARWLTGLGERWLTGLGERWLTGLRERWLTGPVALVLAGSLLGSFLSPAWGPNLWTLLSFGSIAAAILAGAALPAIFKAFYLRSRGHRQVPYRLKALPAGLVVAALCVAVSRATGFRPGYLYGAVIGIRVGPAPGMADAGSEAEEAAGRCTAVGSTAQLLAGLMAWAAWDSLVKTSSVPGAFFGAVLASDFFAAFFVSAVVGTVAALLPLRHLAGYKLKSWDARVWAAIFGAATFVLVQCILRPTSGPGGRSDVALVTTLGLVLLFCARPVLLRLHLPPLRGPQERAGTAVARPPQSLAPADGLLARGPRDRAGI